MGNVERKISELDTWNPIVDDSKLIGDVLKRNGFTDQYNNLNDAAYSIIGQTKSILEVAINPNTIPNNNIGLVIGYVQSGKTLSFTNLIALSVDNNFRLIIVFSGNKKSLDKQTYDRLQDDLLSEKCIIKKDFDDANVVKNLYKKWIDDTLEENDKKTLVIVIMKNAASIKKLIKTIESSDFSNIPTLIIDDEADQASLDTTERKRSKQSINSDNILSSSTYRYINELRSYLNFHSYIQYTATPQSLLLIRNENLLSPDFIKLISPGKGYTGGKTYFIDKTHLLEKIPVDEIKENVDDYKVIPKSLIKAIDQFFISATLNRLEIKQKNFSMLVHPDVKTNTHKKFTGFVKNYRVLLLKILKGEENTTKENKLKVLKNIYDDFNLTYNIKSKFDELFLKNLISVVNHTMITELNTRKSNSSKEIDYEVEVNHIIIGGDILSRGLTIKGLVNSYIPRKHSRQEDTTLQRARFFGYKSDYIDLCRVWLSSETVRFFKESVKSEEANRLLLKEYSDKNKKLDSSKISLIIDRFANPTRSNIIYGDLKRSITSKTGWVDIDMPYLGDLLNNTRSIESFYKLTSHEFYPSDSDNDELKSNHLEGDIDRNIIINMLENLNFEDDSDSNQLFLILNNIIKNSIKIDEEIKVFIMSSVLEDDKIIQRVRERSVNKRGRILNYFQGRSPKDLSKPQTYPGDRTYYDDKKLTIQIHKLLIDKKYECYGLAFNIPNTIALDSIRIVEK